MKDQFRTHLYPKSRIGTYDIGKLSSSKHHVCGLIEVDVTSARNTINQLKTNNYPISFTSWLIKCIGDFANQYPLIHGVKKGKRKIITYSSVDISIIIEKEIDSTLVPIPYIIRGANNKSISDIYNEIKNAKEQLINDEGDFVLGDSPGKFMMNFYYLLPGFVRKFIWKRIIANPSLVKNLIGSVILTSVGMVGTINGWIIPKSIHPLCFAISSTTSKPGVIDSQIAIREYLPITILVDHDVIDGAPAVKILKKLVDALETGYLLEKKPPFGSEK